MRKFTGFILFAFLAMVGTVLAGEQTLRIDPSNTQISFLLESTLHDVHGSLFLDHGELEFNLNSGQASGDIVIDTLRTVSGNAKRDKKMHAVVLETTLFPKIRFSATRIEGQLPTTGSATITLYGKISIHGTDHTTSLIAEVTRDGDRIHATFSLQIPFVEWGMTDPSLFIFRVAKVVDVTIEMDGTLE